MVPDFSPVAVAHRICDSIVVQSHEVSLISGTFVKNTRVIGNACAIVFDYFCIRKNK